MKKYLPPPWIEHGAFRSSVWRSPSWAKAAWLRNANSCFNTYNCKYAFVTWRSGCPSRAHWAGNPPVAPNSGLYIWIRIWIWNADFPQFYWFPSIIHNRKKSHRATLGGSRSSNYIISRMRPSDTSFVLRIRMRFTFNGRRKPTWCLLSLKSLFFIIFYFNC